VDGVREISDSPTARRDSKETSGAGRFLGAGHGLFVFVLSVLIEYDGGVDGYSSAIRCRAFYYTNIKYYLQLPFLFLCYNNRKI